LDVPEVEKRIGITVYATSSAGFGGVIRRKPDDFVVEEILTSGERASVVPEVQFSRLGRYLVCVLIKRNWDTLLAVKAIAGQLGVSVERVAFAGIKDTRALTAQHISLYGVRPEEVARIRISSVRVVPVRYGNEKICELLFGNRFSILVSSISGAQDEVEKVINSIREELLALGGVPNFFGHQRFGTVRPVTHLVGKAIVKGDLEEAAMVFLARSGEFEKPMLREIRDKLFEAQDFGEALAVFPRRFHYERLMLKHLVGYPGDFLGAFRRLPLRLRVLFVQAYQSFLFNMFLSERIHQSKDWCRVNVGDYVVSLDEHGLPMKNGEVAVFENISGLNDAVVDGKACIAVPLVGFRQCLSGGVEGEIERSVLESEGASPEDFVCSKMREVGVPGGLRTVLTPLIDFCVDKPVVDAVDSSHSQLRLGFSLRKSSYATVVLREFMKPQNPIEAGF
jgi:tRNA pseudouridine13 synthase